MFILDVGCGTTPKGDVNLDVQVHACSPNFVLASGLNLPFRDGCFDMVVSFNVIEHVPDPLWFFRELARVSRDMVVVGFPHRLGDSRSNWDRSKPFPHLHRFNVEWFRNAAKLLGLVVLSEGCTYRHWPFLSGLVGQYLGFLVRLPGEVTLHLHKPCLEVT